MTPKRPYQDRDDKHQTVYDQTKKLLKDSGQAVKNGGKVLGAYVDRHVPLEAKFGLVAAGTVAAVLGTVAGIGLIYEATDEAYLQNPPPIQDNRSLPADTLENKLDAEPLPLELHQFESADTLHYID